IAAAVVAFAALAGSAGAAGSPDFQLIRAGKPSDFPTQKYVLSLKTVRPLTIHDVSVTENGGKGLHPRPRPRSGAAAQTFGVVLVLDTSYSMNGEPLNAALAAEQAFAKYRNPNQQLGAIEFNRDSTVVLPLTTKESDITKALTTVPTVKTGTHIFD